MSNIESSSICSLVRLTGHSYIVKTVVFSPNGEYLASGSYDNTIGIWRVSNGERVKTLRVRNYVSSVVFSPNGEYLASGSRKKISLW